MTLTDQRKNRAPDTGAQKHYQDIVSHVRLGADASIISLVESTILYGNSTGASDIHIDPTRDHVCIRFRIDGILTTVYTCPLQVHETFISRLKILSGLRTDEHLAAQDGRFRCHLEKNSWIDVRISIAPTYYGENAVLRLLAPMSDDQTLSSLGFSEDHCAALTRAITRTSGLILVTGPTGSGKTTTLYALMRMLARESISVVSIEDPIEYSIPMVTQIPANQRAGLGFAQGLRSILRQDPDVIMVGEIRDEETAGLAINAALTGHLVLSTMHTTDAITAIPRLIDLKIEPYLIAATVKMAIAQRLVRTVCGACVHLDPHGGQVSACSTCDDNGYAGRTGIYEVLEISTELETAISQRKDKHELLAIAHREGMQSLHLDGSEKVRNGITSALEVARMTYA